MRTPNDEIRLPLMVIYGSESSLIRPLIQKRDHPFIRIYGKTVPESDAKCIDIPDVSDLEDAIKKIKTKIGNDTQNPLLDIVFLGAAFKTQTSLFLGTKPEEIDEAIHVNITNYTKIVYTLLPHMMRSRWGRLIYLSSFRSQVTGKGTSIYSASKAFGEKFFEVVGKEFGRLGITSTSIRMGYFDGRMTDIFNEKEKTDITQNIACRRFGDSNDLLNAIQFCIDNPFVNSGVVDLNGGLIFN